MRVLQEKDVRLMNDDVLHSMYFTAHDETHLLASELVLRGFVDKKDADTNPILQQISRDAGIA